MIARPWRLDDWMTRVRKDCSGCLWSLKSWVACCRHRLLWSRNYRGLSALSIISTSQALLSCWYVHCLMPSHHCGADLVQLYCIWRWPHLFILVALTEASTAGDGTDFHTQGDQAQPPVHHISCQWYSSPIISHEIWNPVHCCCHGSVSSKSLELGNSGSILGIQLSGIG